MSNFLKTPHIRQADETDIPALYALYEKIGQKDEGYFEALFEKDCVILIASIEKENVGFGILNFEPKYQLYKKLELPEIQDLNVIPEARGQGIATELIFAFESLAIDQGANGVGISVGLTKDYGPAQRLYCKLGYQPDGYGVTYDRAPVKAGVSYPVDDDLCLMMVKDL
jgi:ribosomal protein S18 acetylase RimI-like enzyme